MSAYLVERDPAAYQRLEQVRAQYPDVAVQTYSGDFLSIYPEILRTIPAAAFAFFLIDPKGWRIPLRTIEPVLARPRSEMTFNFMFDFINRAASIRDPLIANGLDELIPYGDWRTKLEAAEKAVARPLNSDERKVILIEAFKDSLRKIGNYQYVAETTVLRPLLDRPLYCLFYATRHEKGIEVFRDCQIKALAEQSKTRAATKLTHAETSSGQGEFFKSLHDMAPDELSSFLASERTDAERTLLDLTPHKPSFISYEKLWPQILSRHVIKLADVNKIAAQLRHDGRLHFPNWEQGRRVPQASYKVQRPN